MEGHFFAGVACYQNFVILSSSKFEGNLTQTTSILKEYFDSEQDGCLFHLYSKQLILTLRFKRNYPTKRLKLQLEALKAFCQVRIPPCETVSPEAA